MLYTKAYSDAHCKEGIPLEGNLYEHMYSMQAMLYTKAFQTLTVRKAFLLKGNLYEHTG